MKIFSSFLLAVAISISIIPSGSAQPVSHPSQGDNQFAFDIYSQINSKPGNIFFSPYSLSSALGMAYEGARGQTAQEMKAVLHLNADDANRRAETSSFIQQINRTDKTYELSVANALWAQKACPFKNDYLNLIKNIYFAEARNLDFVSNPEASRLTINNWVSDKTKNHINDLLPVGGVTSNTRLVLTDAVYFKSKWVAPFEKEGTKSEIFWRSSDDAEQADMMMLVGKEFNYTENDQVQVLQLPYLGNDLSMIIILPRSKDIEGLEKKLTLDMFKQWQEEMALQEVNVFLPKFKFYWEQEISGLLGAIGMRLAFDPMNADFSGMANKIPDANLYISGVYHKAWIDTNEQGTEAAAATAIGMMAGSAIEVIQEPKVFRADHPFIFVIQDNITGHILFMGRVSDPREK